jgi:hypothetical protein
MNIATPNPHFHDGGTVKPLVRRIDLAPIPTPADCLNALKPHRPGSRLFREAEIVARICRDDWFLEQCILAIYAFQDIEERSEGRTKFKNRIGFSAADAKLFGPMAEKILAGDPLSPAQLAICRRLDGNMPRLGRYRGQLLKIKDGVLQDLRSSLVPELSTDETASDEDTTTSDVIGGETIQ